MRLLILALLASFAVAAPAVAQGPAPSNTVAGEVPPKPPLKLTDEQKQRVAQAINGQDTLAKLPAGFAPAVGARAPSEDAVAEYPLPRPLVYEVPVLKQYYYVQLDDQVLIVDPMTKTVARSWRGSFSSWPDSFRPSTTSEIKTWMPGSSPRMTKSER